MNGTDAIEADAPAAADLDGVPEVEELQERLRQVDAAMELLQAGELDAAERAIEALESRTTTSPVVPVDELSEASADDEAAVASGLHEEE